MIALQQVVYHIATMALYTFPIRIALRKVAKLMPVFTFPHLEEIPVFVNKLIYPAIYVSLLSTSFASASEIVDRITEWREQILTVDIEYEILLEQINIDQEQVPKGYVIHNHVVKNFVYKADFTGGNLYFEHQGQLNNGDTRIEKRAFYSGAFTGLNHQESSDYSANTAKIKGTIKEWDFNYGTYLSPHQLLGNVWLPYDMRDLLTIGEIVEYPLGDVVVVSVKMPQSNDLVEYHWNVKKNEISEISLVRRPPADVFPQILELWENSPYELYNKNFSILIDAYIDINGAHFPVSAHKTWYRYDKDASNSLSDSLEKGEISKAEYYARYYALPPIAASVHHYTFVSGTVNDALGEKDFAINIPNGATVTDLSTGLISLKGGKFDWHNLLPFPPLYLVPIIFGVLSLFVFVYNKIKARQPASV